MKWLTNLFMPEICPFCRHPVENQRQGPFCAECLVRWECAKTECAGEVHGQPVRNLGSLDEGNNSALYMVQYKPGDKNSVVNRLIYKLKNRPTNAVVSFIAIEFERMLKESAGMLFDDTVDRSNVLITWIPRNPDNIEKFGVDQMALCANALSKRIGFEKVCLFERKRGSSEQKKLDVSHREINMRENMKIKSGRDVKGKIVILIDDIVTTGASLRAATDLLLKNGAKLVICVVIAATSGERR